MPNLKALERNEQRIQVNSLRKLFRLIIGQVDKTGIPIKREESGLQPIKI
jgi:hypothetical protein